MNNKILIPPMPKEYSIYSNQEKLEKTEQFYLEMEGIYNRVDKARPHYEERINALLQKGSTCQELIPVLLEEEAQLLCLYSYSFKVLRQVCNIAELEREFNECSAFRNVQSIDEIMQKHQKCVFLLRRLEMNWEEDKELLLLMKTGEVSYIFLAEVLCVDLIIRKIYTGCKVATYLFGNGLLRESILFLVWLEKRLPYSEEKIVLFTQTLLDMGEMKLAYDVLIKHENPDKDILNLQSTLRDIL